MQPPTNNYYPRPRRTHRLAGFLVLAACVAAVVIAFVNRQNIYDWAQLRNYTPPASIAKLATQDTMTAYARKILYVNHPSIENKTTFFTNCPNNGGEKTIVLGCYHSDQQGIFLLSVTDPRLNGVSQVTAAHEMLHGAYDRLSGSEREKVDTMLLDYYHHDLHDPRILSTIAAYKQSEPNDVVNEMHSVFGTEIASLPAGLEQYYKRYFTNRPAIAAYAAQYQAQFTSRQATVTQDDARLASLKTQITTAEADLKTKQTAINTGEAQLLQERSSSDITDYNAGVPSYNDLIDAYNAEVGSTKSLIDQYNQLVVSRNSVAFEEDQLIDALSSQPAPAKQ